MSWFKPKSNDKQINIKCPACGCEQEVAEGISAVFCKKCKKTIFPKKIQNSEPEENVFNEQTENVEISETIEETAEKEQKTPLKEDSPPKAKEPEVPKKEVKEPVANPFAGAGISSGMKKIKCSNCNTLQEVPSIALASFCESCGQRINLQDYKIKGPFHGELETRGEIRVATGAEVKANLNVGSAVVDGKINGKISAESRVELNGGCLVVGTINSPVLIVNDGAGFVGKAIINPPKDMKI